MTDRKRGIRSLLWDRSRRTVSAQNLSVFFPECTFTDILSTASDFGVVVDFDGDVDVLHGYGYGCGHEA